MRFQIRFKFKIDSEENLLVLLNIKIIVPTSTSDPITGSTKALGFEPRRMVLETTILPLKLRLYVDRSPM